MMSTLVLRFYLLIFLSILSSAILHGEYKWTPQHSGTTANLRGVWFVDSLNGWVCGDSGIILHTTNGGRNWERCPSNTNVPLQDIFFINLFNGWVCGDSGTVLRTTNGGNNWYLSQTTISDNLHHTQFIDDSSGVVTGEKGLILTTTNGGSDWVTDSVDHTQNFDVAFYIQNVSSFCYSYSFPTYSTHVYTLDRGMTWDGTPQYNSRITDMTGYQVNSYRSFYWDVGTRGFVLRIDDRGLSEIGGQTGDTLTLNAITLEKGTTPLSLWAVGEQGRVINSIDSGLTWQTISIGISVSLNELSFPATGKGWIVGDSGFIFLYDVLTTAGESDNKIAPDCFELHDLYPNPFNPSTTISYSLSEASWVTLNVYNLLGQQVATVADGIETAGNRTVLFNAGNLPSGVYYCRIHAISLNTSGQPFADVKKIVLMR